MGEMTTHTMRQLEAEANHLLIQAGNPELVHPKTNDALHPTHATTYGNATDAAAPGYDANTRVATVLYLTALSGQYAVQH